VWAVFVDGVEVGRHQRLGANSLAFGPAGMRYTYAAWDGRSWCVMLDGIAGSPYAQVGEVAFSPAGDRAAYPASRGRGGLVVVDGVEGRRYDQIGAVVFSPDGAHTAYQGRRGSGWHVVVDAMEGPAFDALAPGGPQFGARGVEYVAVRGNAVYRVQQALPETSPGRR
jgi:hypothetical protein